MIGRPAGDEALQCSESRPQIALLTPYSGNNFGDAAIQDAMIANIRLRLPGAQFSGICLNCDNFVQRHGVSAFALCGTDRPFYGMSTLRVSEQSRAGERLTERASRQGRCAAAAKWVIGRLPLLRRCLRPIYALGRGVRREIRHCIEGYRFLSRQNILIVSGGGQLDEEWGGAWGHPFSLVKWAILARIVQIPYVIASVGACKVSSTTTRLLLSATLRMARYRSYRDKNSRALAAGLLPRAAEDLVVPDMAFSLPFSDLAPPVGIRAISHGRTVVAVSPIAYAKPGSWPDEDSALYDRYLQQMALGLSQFLERGYFLVIVRSTLSDESVVPELLERLDKKSKHRIARQVHVPTITTWKDFAASLREVDFLIASRLHSAILGFVNQTHTIAISFDPKVETVMEDVGQTAYLLQIRDFTAKELIQTIEDIELHREKIIKQLASYKDQIASTSGRQYDALGELIAASRRRRAHPCLS